MRENLSRFFFVLLEDTALTKTFVYFCSVMYCFCILPVVI
ncbi:hypothetical protein ANACAC_00519 [Anaerostipes caccae L1-92]|uniref:Uncharacterized protein n=1 Tax=Anaerostipes caccae (strain DSM 14662 / CCUG 47493 / JCM 13470 / NCIMB 13811 / L1-92) TaxID=411490 RepID=B0MAE4_ANACD|nr:hypothetical protein ANACAC_00519 [Anaerostipes caccae L1-92]